MKPLKKDQNLGVKRLAQLKPRYEITLIRVSIWGLLKLTNMYCLEATTIRAMICFIL